jgi:hypothetical protein
MRIWALLALTLAHSQLFAGMGQGIYVREDVLLNDARFTDLIEGAESARIDTFVVDIAHPSERYAAQIAKVKAAGLRYVARVVMFPGGGSASEIRSEAYWEIKYRLVEAALNSGADAIQLDYIRYSSKTRRSAQNARDIDAVIAWFQQRLSVRNVPLQIDVFGIALLGESPYIGQNIKLFSDKVQVVCPMTYPSHYAPYLEHRFAPYQAVRELLEAMKGQFEGPLPFAVNPYIEVGNFRYPMPESQRISYILAQIDAAKDAGAQGWYAWSANNRYQTLFKALAARDSLTASKQEAMHVDAKRR